MAGLQLRLQLSLSNECVLDFDDAPRKCIVAYFKTVDIITGNGNVIVIACEQKKSDIVQGPWLEGVCGSCKEA